MDENKTAPEGTAPAPEPTPDPTPAAAPVETPSAPMMPPAAPEPAQAGYEAQYAAQPAPTAQSAPNAPMPTAPVSPTPALVCGILSIVFCGIPIVGIILGIVAIVMAGKYFRAGGTEGTAKGGKICGIVGIVLSVLTIIATLVLFMVALNTAQSYQTTTSSLSSYQSESSSSSTLATDADEEEIFAAVDPYLDQIKNQDPEMVAVIADIMEESFDEAMDIYDITLADTGIDPQQLALAMIEGFDYSQGDASVHGSIASCDYLVTVRDILSVLNEFYDGFDDPTDAVAVGQALMAAIEACPPEPNNYWSVDLSNDTGSWIMDSESWEDELDSYFALV